MIDIGIEDVSSSASIFYTTLKNYTEMNDYLKEVVLNHRKEYPETNVTNVKSSWTSSYYTHHETDKFNLLIDEVCSVCECISGSHYNLESSYQPINMWAMMYEEGDFAIKHHHFPTSVFSCCYYIDVEDDCSPIIFEDEISITPENGLLLVWPSFLFHEIPPTKGRRMCISMNIDKILDM